MSNGNAGGLFGGAAKLGGIAFLVAAVAPGALALAAPLLTAGVVANAGVSPFRAMANKPDLQPTQIQQTTVAATAPVLHRYKGI